jgi:quercetin dioxygenase-like cupin family protein
MNLASQIDYKDDRVNSMLFRKTENYSLHLLALKEGQKLSTHSASTDVTVIVLEGKVEFDLLGKNNSLKKDDSILLPKDEPHAVTAVEDTKFLLIR